MLKDEICGNRFDAEALNGLDIENSRTKEIILQFPQFFTKDYQDEVSASLLNVKIGSLEVLFHEAGVC